MYLLNARSVRNKFSELRPFIQCNRPDVVVITESWLRDDEKSVYNINGYASFFDCRQSSTRGGGVAVYVSERCGASEVSVNVSE